MKRIGFLLFVTLAMLAGTHKAYAQGKVAYLGINSARAAFLQSSNRTLSADTTYILRCFYKVQPGAVLTIPAGTVILGDTGSYLLVKVGGQLIAQGTAVNPIHIRSIRPPSQRAAGDWGGLVILGNATVNQPTAPFIEGINAPDESYGQLAGSGLNDAHNGGALQYLYLGHPGFRLGPDNEINGLTMGGVGTGTTVDHVMVAYSQDDGFEWFGGTADAKHIITFGARDDEFDTDFGYSGRVQFALSIDDPLSRETQDLPTSQQSNGFESDNTGSAPFLFTPNTSSRFSNATLIGPERIDAITALPKYEYGVVARRNTQLSIHNSIIMGHRGGYSLRDSVTKVGARDGLLQARNITLQTRATVGLRAVVETGTNPPSGWTTARDWFMGTNPVATTNNDTLNGNPSLLGSRLQNLTDLNNPDPRPLPGDALLTGAGRVAYTGNDLNGEPFWSQVNYRGALDPSLSLDAQWGGNFTAWTDFNPQYANYAFSGWNMITATLDMADKSANAVFPGRFDGPYTYDPAIEDYVLASTITPGRGYFVLYETPKVLKYRGNAFGAVSYASTGTGTYYMQISGKSSEVPAASLVFTGGSLLDGPIAWDPATQDYAGNVTTLLPGQSYWVLVDGTNVQVTVP